MDRLLPINRPQDIPPQYQDTPIGLLLEYHNLGRTFEPYTRARLLIGMCMDNRKVLRTPDNFAYVIRAGGANLRYSEFKVSFALAVGGAEAIVVVGHTNCGMSGLVNKREQFINGLVEQAGWERERAEEHFNQFAPMFEIGNVIDFTAGEARRLNDRYPKIQVAPMIYRVEDNMLYLISEEWERKSVV
jgi:carbonic anhydrase